MWVRVARVKVIDQRCVRFSNTNKNAPRNAFAQ